MKQPVLLCYNLSGERARGVRMAAMRLKVRVREVRKDEYALPVGSLCGLEGLQGTQETAGDFSDEMLVMAFFPAGMMNLFLQTMRRTGAGYIALKAVLTETNAQWDSLRLHAELSREREALAAGATSAHGNAKE